MKRYFNKYLSLMISIVIVVIAIGYFSVPEISKAAISVSILGSSNNTAGTSPWTALTGLSVSADDYVIVCDAGDSGTTGINIGTIANNLDYTSGGPYGVSIYQNYQKAQSFTPTSTTKISTVGLKSYKTGSPTDSLNLNIYLADVNHKPTGGSLASGSIPAASVSTSSTVHYITPSDYTYIGGIEYVLVWSSETQSGDGYYTTFEYHSNQYDDGVWLASTDGGSSWSVDTDDEYTFKITFLEIATALNADVTANNAGNVVAKIWSGKVSVTGTSWYIVITNTSDAKAMTAYKVSGLNGTAIDATNSATGSGSTITTGATGVLEQADEIVFASFNMEEEDDELGSVTAGAGYVSGNDVYSSAVKGGAKSITVYSVAEIVSTTDTQQGEMTSTGGNDWGGCIASYKMEVVAGTPDISNTPSSYNFTTVAVSTNYSTGLSAFNVTNSSGFAVDITIYSSNATGGNGWTLSDTAIAGSDIFGLKAGLNGGSYNVTIKGEGSTPYNVLVYSLADSGVQGWGIQLICPTEFSDGDWKSANITISASAS